MRIAKTVVASVGAIVTVLTAAFADNVFSASEMGTTISCLIEQGITVYAVYKVRNKGFVELPAVPPNNP